MIYSAGEIIPIRPLPVSEDQMVELSWFLVNTKDRLTTSLTTAVLGVSKEVKKVMQLFSASREFLPGPPLSEIRQKCKN